MYIKCTVYIFNIHLPRIPNYLLEKNALFAKMVVNVQFVHVHGIYIHICIVHSATALQGLAH